MGIGDAHAPITLLQVKKDVVNGKNVEVFITREWPCRDNIVSLARNTIIFLPGGPASQSRSSSGHRKPTYLRYTVGGRG